jgi:hypothetical protein
MSALSSSLFLFPHLASILSLDPSHRRRQLELIVVSSSFSQVLPGGKIKKSWRVEFLEIDLEMFKPKQGLSIWSAIVPEIHGTILCYNAQDKSTLDGLDIATRKLLVHGHS